MIIGNRYLARGLATHENIAFHDHYILWFAKIMWDLNIKKY